MLGSLDIHYIQLVLLDFVGNLLLRFLFIEKFHDNISQIETLEIK